MIDPPTHSPRPTEPQLAWADAELGVIIHLDLQVFEPGYEFRQAWGYTPDPTVFNPTELDTDQWLEAAVAAGAKYAVLVAKHCSGFSLWPTQAHAYSVASSPWRNGRGDIVADFFRSCEKFGVKPGLYCSLSCNAYFNVDNPGLVRDRDPEKQARYNAMALQQLTELWTNYGPLFEIWFDGGVLPPEQGGPDVAGLMARLQPDAVVFQGPNTWAHPVRDSGNELATAVLPNWSTTDADSYQANNGHNHGGNPGGDLWAAAECDIPNRKAGQAFQGGWFWREGDDPFIYSGDELIEGYFRSVGQNSNLLIGMVINSRGRFPEPDARAFTDFGDKLRRIFSHQVATTSGTGRELRLTLPPGSRPTVLVLQEDLTGGERVRQFSVDALAGGEWRPIWNGTCIGHKRIERFEPLAASELRLKILESVGEPRIRAFSAYAVEPSLFMVPLNLAQRSKLYIGRNREGIVSITCSNPSLAIRYTTDGGEPTESSEIYSEPFRLTGSGTVKAFAYLPGGDCRSETTAAEFGVLRDAWRIVSASLDSPFANNGAAGILQLLDDDPRTYWHTYHADKLLSAPPHHVVVDMCEPIEIAAFTMMPRLFNLGGTPDRFYFELSQDGETWLPAAAGEFTDIKEHPVIRCIALNAPQTGRYLRFTAGHALDDADFIALAGIGVITTGVNDDPTHGSTD